MKLYIVIISNLVVSPLFPFDIIKVDIKNLVWNLLSILYCKAIVHSSPLFSALVLSRVIKISVF